jgi:hypothetical protein
LEDGPKATPPTPLFALELVMDGGKFAYNTPPASFEKVITKIYSSALTSLQNIAQLEPAIMVVRCRLKPAEPRV